MESQSGLVVMQAAQIATDTVEQDLLLVSGSIGSSGVQLAPVQALRGVAKPESGAYTLRLTTRDGRSFTHAFTADLVDHAEPPERQFAVAVPDPGVPIASVEVLHGTTPIATNARVLRPSAPTRRASIDCAPSTGARTTRC